MYILFVKEKVNESFMKNQIALQVSQNKQKTLRRF